MTSLFWTGRLVVIITFEGVLWPPDCLQGWIYARGSHRSTIRRTLDLARPTLCVLRSIPPSSQHRGGGLQYDEPTFMGSRLVAVVVCGEAHHRGVSFLYYNEREKERTVAQDSGALLCDGVESLCIHGICPETEWPYIVANYRKPPPAQCYQDARLNRSSVVQNLANNLVSMKSPVCTTQQNVCTAHPTCLAAMNRPFVVGIQIFPSFESAAVAATGMVPMPGAGERPLGGHAVLVCGYDDRTIRGEPCVCPPPSCRHNASWFETLGVPLGVIMGISICPTNTCWIPPSPLTSGSSTLSVTAPPDDVFSFCLAHTEHSMMKDDDVDEDVVKLGGPP